MNLDMLKLIFLNTAAAALPFLIGGLVLLAAVSYSPLGRLWIGYLWEPLPPSSRSEIPTEIRTPV